MIVPMATTKYALNRAHLEMRRGRELVTIHSLELCAELLGSEPGEGPHQDPAPEKVAPTTVSSPPRQYLSSPTRIPSRSSTAQMTRVDDWLSRKARRAVITLPEDPELTKLRDLCQTITDSELEFLSELDTFVAAQQDGQRSKSKALYNKWCERVFDPLQRRLSAQMTDHDPVSANRFKRELFGQYLEYKNRKDVFLDTINAEEYQPMKLDQELEVCIGSLDDPLVSQRTEFAQEQLVLRGCDEGFPPPPDSTLPAGSGCKDPDCVLWLAVHLLQIDSTARERTRNCRLGLRNKSSLDRNAELANGAESEDLFRKELNIPHKQPIHYPRQPLLLTHSEQAYSLPQTTPPPYTQ